ncbi:hypothetical protein ACFTWF_23265 [Rhodococcus sp. NPDC056960]|uniref:hypothetical protein n=1 Tax=Rhodococcus sp. NPDC056960 TaxID=3345982 RepID=UPI003625ECF2
MIRTRTTIPVAARTCRCSLSRQLPPPPPWHHGGLSQDGNRAIALRRTASQQPARQVEGTVELDTDYYDRGIQARHAAHGQLTDATNILDGIEDQADKILADLLRILDDIRTEPRD